MKQKDIALILVVGFVGLVFALVLSNVLFNSKDSKMLTVDIVTAISPDFETPDNGNPELKKFFNEQSIDPTQIIRIGENTNQKPFNQ